MIKKGLKLAAAVFLCSVVASPSFSAHKMHSDYKDMAIPTVKFPDTSVYVGYSFAHNYYRSTWENSFRRVTGYSPPNNFNGIVIGLDKLLTNWLALDLRYGYFFSQGSGAGDARLSGLTVSALGIYNFTNTSIFLLGKLGATVTALSHDGDNGINTINPSFVHSDVSPVIGAGLQFSLAENFYLRPMINWTYQDRSDANSSLGLTLDLVYGLS